MISHSDEVKFKLPCIDPSKIFTETHSVFTIREYTLNHDLLHQLVLYDFSGKESMQNLTNFGLAVNKRSFNIANISIRGPHLDLSTLLAHCTLAKLVASNSNNRYMSIDCINPMYSDIFKILTGAGNVLLGYVFESLIPKLIGKETVNNILNYINMI